MQLKHNEAESKICSIHHLFLRVSTNKVTWFVQIRWKWKTVRPPTNHTAMKQYTMRISDGISCDIAFHTLPFPLRMLITENKKTYTHKMVDVEMNMKKNQ